MNYKQLLKNETARNFLTLFTGSALAQIIPFAFEPILTRLFTPAQFAVLAIYISVANLFAIASTGRYEMAIMLPRTNREAINIAALSFFICTAVTLFSLVIVVVFNHQISLTLNNHLVGPFLYFIPLSVFLTGCYQIINYWTSRQKHFTAVSAGRLAQTTSTSLLNMASGLLKSGHSGLVYSYLTGYAVSLVTLTSFLRKTDWKHLKLISRVEIKKLAHRYSDFPKINSLHAFTDILQQSLLIFLLSYFFTDTVVGSYSRTFRLLAAPASLIGAALGQVFFQQASSRFARGERIRNLTLKSMTGLAIVAIPGFSIIALWGSDIFGFILGEDWATAGLYASAIAPWLCMNLIISPISSVPLITGNQKTAFLLSLIGNSIILGSIYFGGIVWENEVSSFKLLGGLMILYYCGLIWWFIKISGTQPTAHKNRYNETKLMQMPVI